MERHVVRSCAVLALLAGAGVAQAQEPARSPSRFDVGAYAGGSWTSSWLEVKDDQFPVGYHPIFGGFTTGWLQPTFGVRLHGAYIPAELPEPSRTEITGIPDGRLLNIWLYDLDLMYRPFVQRTAAPYWLSSLYVFAGGGGLTANVAGDSSTTAPAGVDRGCVYPYTLSDACLSYSPSYATVGQGTVGAGLTLFPLTDRIGVFGEMGLHVYDSPFHVREGLAPDPGPCAEDCVGRDRLAFTPRLVAGLLLGTGGRRPPPVPPLLPPPPPPPLPAEQPVRLCVLVNDVPQYVDAVVRPETGDTLVTVNGQQQPLAVAYPQTGYAQDRPFYANQEAVPYAGRRYLPFGLPRAVAPGELQRVGDYQGIGLFTEVGATSPPAVLYLPVRPYCEYQPYQLEQEVRRVRG